MKAGASASRWRESARQPQHLTISLGYGTANFSVGMRAERGIGIGPCPDPPRPAGRPPTRGPSLSLRRSETVVERSKHSYREKTGFLRGGAFPFFRVSTNRPLVHTDSPSREGGLREVGRIVNRYKSPAKNGSRTDQELSVGDRPRTAPDCSSTAPLGDAGCGPRVALVEKRSMVDTPKEPHPFPFKEGPRQVHVLSLGLSC